MPRAIFGFVLAFFSVSFASAKIAVFWQPGFPTVSSEPIARATLENSLSGEQASFLGVDALVDPASLKSVDLLVMPYGSAFAEKDWDSIHAFLKKGGSLLVLGGQPFRVPVSGDDGNYKQNPATDAYSRELGVLHTYEAPQTDGKLFAWKPGYSFLGAPKPQAKTVFVLEGRRLDGLGYMLNSSGEKVAAPVVVSDHMGPMADGMAGSRWVFLDFQPVPGYWDTPDGVSLIRAAAEYAREGASFLQIEMQFSTVKKGETPQATVHLRATPQRHVEHPATGQITVELMSGDQIVSTQQVPCNGDSVSAGIDFLNTLSPGFYNLRATYKANGKPQEFYENGFWIEDPDLLNSGPVLASQGDFLTKDGKPFFPFGTNYFSTEGNGWDFSGPRNADVWERDFADMEKHGVTFVRTGVWGGQSKIVEQPQGEASERFLRNVEAYLLCARRHNIVVNFTFFAFDPQSTLRTRATTPLLSLPGTNPYLDPITIEAEQNYMLSIVNRFKLVPYLSWDLINEPSFSNPSHLWHGNTPNGDPAELHAWHEWLRGKYGEIQKLATAWSVTPDSLKSFESVPLPGAQALAPDLEDGNFAMVRAYDYNLFAQDSFSSWVKNMVTAIRSAGSKQLIDVGQDEGGVENRLLNQFYGTAGLSFTTNHTYRQNQALLWDSIAAKVPGVPNIVGETGYQPITYPNGEWHFDELTGFGLIERKWAAGLANGTSGALSWDWDREIYFGIERSDGSAKTWEDLMRNMGSFVKKAEPHATALELPEVAIVLPQSLQLSIFNHLAIEAQQKCVRALYGIAHSEAYAVGENQIGHLGHPKLIILPSPWVLNSSAWTAILKAVNDGATLLVSGRFDLDPHFLPVDRGKEIGISYRSKLLDTIENRMNWPGGTALLTYGENKTDYLQAASLPGGQTFVEKQTGKGKILFSALPIELNDNLQAIGQIYSYALKQAGVAPVYTSTLQNDGILISPTRLPDSTLYVISSEADERAISFRDERSGKGFSGQLEPGRAAMLLVGEKGETLASYNW